MRRLPVAVAFLVAPFAAAEPTSGYDEFPVFEGVLAQGERDHAYEWHDLWFPEDELVCTSEIRDDLFVLRILDGDPRDEVTLTTNDPLSLGEPITTRAVGPAPAVQYGRSYSGCVEFVVEGQRVESTVRYQVEFTNQFRILGTIFGEIS